MGKMVSASISSEANTCMASHSPSVRGLGAPNSSSPSSSCSRSSASRPPSWSDPGHPPCSGSTGGWGGPFRCPFPDMFAITVDPRISLEATLIDLGRLALRQPFGPPDIIAWHELLEAVTIHESDLDQIVDRISWHLEPSGKFSTKSLCWAIAATPAPEPLELIWSIRLPQKIKIFLWQWIRGHVPFGMEVLKRYGAHDGIHPLCGTVEDSYLIFFSCVSAQFLSSYLREAIGGRWCNTNFPDLFAKIQASPPTRHHIRWLASGVLSWTLWTVWNKLVIQRVPLLRASDAVFKMCGYL
ncbi:ABC transporter G family member 37 [Hordeum vulgare]|nr:ABC transporter G family member 37 [Hordeum vulgare]